MKKILFFFFFIGLTLSCWPQHCISEEEAVRVAQNKMKAMLGQSNNEIDSVYFFRSVRGDVLLYEVVMQSGYSIIVSGSRGYFPILGVINNADRVSFFLDTLNCPDFVQFAFSGHKTAIEESFSSPINRFYQTQWDSLLSGMISFQQSNSCLITSRWTESVSNDGIVEDTYNYYSPIINGCKAPVGSAAVAMGQLMYYWNYPCQIVGQTDLFPWCKMSDEIFSTDICFEEERNAVARLLRVCGDAAQMTYSCTSSNATTSNVVTALRSAFFFKTKPNFDNPGAAPPIDDQLGMALYNTYWENIIDDIDHGYPVLCYWGNNGYGLCDGYSGSYNFHFVWGDHEGFINVFGRNISFLRNIKPQINASIGTNLYLSDFYQHYLSQAGNVHPSRLVPGGADALFSASSECDLSWRTIPSGIVSIYQAQVEVNLQDGFEAEAGCEFEARIEPCALCDEAGNNMQGANLPEGMASVGDQPDTTGGTVAYAVGQPQELPADALFPNPTDGPLTMSTDGMAQAVLVYTLSGNPVGGWRMNSLTETSLSLDVSALAPGTYLLSVATPTGTQTAKFIRR